MMLWEGGPARVGVLALVCVHRLVFVEGDAVLTGTAAHLVVASAAFDPIGAVVAADGVVASAAEHRVGSAASLDVVVAAEAIDHIVVGSANNRVVAFGAVKSGHSN